MTMEQRVAEWVVSKIGSAGMDRRERALRLLEEAVELAQAEGITLVQVARQVAHVYERPAGDPEQEAGGVAVCLLGWCAATDTTFADIAELELARIEAKPIDEIRGSLSRKHDADLVTVADTGTQRDQIDVVVDALRVHIGNTSDAWNAELAAEAERYRHCSELIKRTPQC